MATTTIDEIQARPSTVTAYDRYQAVLDWVKTTDHKKIGILYLTTSLVFFLIGGIEALLMRWQLATADSTFLSPHIYNQLMTMHGLTMIFPVVMPVLVGFANFFL